MVGLDPLIVNNLGMAILDARKMVGSKLDPDELKQACLIGLWKAFLKFDPNLGYKFYSYAKYYVRLTIIETLNERFLIKKPKGATPLPVTTTFLQCLDIEQIEKEEDDVRECYQQLNKTEQYILEKHLGLDGEQWQMFSQIASDLKISRDEAIAIKRQAIEKLREAYA